MADFQGIFCRPFLPSVLIIEGVGRMGGGAGRGGVERGGVGGIGRGGWVGWEGKGWVGGWGGWVGGEGGRVGGWGGREGGRWQKPPLGTPHEQP